MSSDTSSNKLNIELLNTWYQSYYMWHSTYLSSLTYRPLSQYHIVQSLPQTATIVDPSRTRPVTPTSDLAQQAPNRRIYKVPSLVKRLLAEGIDSICIQLIKLVIGVLIINQTDLMDEGYLKLIDIVEDLLSGEGASNINIPIEVLFIEAIYVSVSIVFEVTSLYLKGYTLGKYFFKLKIVSCTQINENAYDHTIQVVPGTELTLKTILLRTCLKNLSILVFFPTIVFLLLPAFFEYGQTSYDKAAKTIVVELVD